MSDTVRTLLQRLGRRMLGIKAESTTLRNPATWLLDWLGGGGETKAGVRVSRQVAYSLSAYYCGVRTIAETIGTLPLNVYRRSGRRREIADSHPAHFLLHNEPNPEMTAASFRRTLVANAINHGNGYAEIERDSNGFPVALWPLSSQTWPRRDENGDLFYETWANGKPFVLAPNQVLHIPMLGCDGIVGYSLIHLAAESIGLAAAQRNYAAKYFKNGGNVSAVIQTEQTLDDKAFERLKLELKANLSGLDNAHRVAILEHGLQWNNTNLSHADAQLVEAMKFSIEEWARWLNMPPHMLKDLSNASFSNIEHQGIEFATLTIAPWCTLFEQEYNRKLFYQKARFYTKHNIAGLMRGDLKSRYEAYAIGRQWGWLSPNMILDTEDENPLPGDQGDMFLVPSNMIPADMAREKAKPQPAPAPAPATPPGGDPNQPNDPQGPAQQRALAVVRAQAERLVRLESEKLRGGRWRDAYYGGHVASRAREWLNLGEDDAAAYVNQAKLINLAARDGEIDDEERDRRKVSFLINLASEGIA